MDLEDNHRIDPPPRSAGFPTPSFCPTAMNSRLRALRPLPRGFTLIELLTVIAIIGILAAIIIPTVGKVRASAKKAQCLSNMRQWGTAARLFSNDHKGLVALYNNLGGGTPSPQIYSPYFSQTKMIDPAGQARSSQEVMSRCPVAITDTSDTNFRARCYAFVRGGGVNGPGIKRVDSSVFGLTPGTLIPAYNIGDAAAPSRYPMMMETHTPQNNAITIDAITGANGFDQYVRPVQVNSDAQLVRHGGSANFVFLDGHVASFSASDTDYSVPANKPIMDQWFKLK